MQASQQINISNNETQASYSACAYSSEMNSSSSMSTTSSQEKLALEKYVAERDVQNDDDLNGLLKVAETASHVDCDKAQEQTTKVFRTAKGKLIYPATHPTPPTYDAIEHSSRTAFHTVATGMKGAVNRFVKEFAKKRESADNYMNDSDVWGRTIGTGNGTLSTATVPVPVTVPASAPSKSKTKANKKINANVHSTVGTKRSSGKTKAKASATNKKSGETNEKKGKHFNANGNGTIPTSSIHMNQPPKKKNKITLPSTVPRGVTVRPSGKWQAQLYFAGKSRYIGVFDSREKAALAYEIAREHLKDKNVNGSSQKNDTDVHVNAARKAAFQGVNEAD